MQTELPPRVALALARAREAGFTLSCEEGVGRLLAALSAAVRLGGRVLEMGTGAGVGTAWIVEGLAARSDVELTSIEMDAAMYRLARDADWPAGVKLVEGDVLAHLERLGRFDLIFADAQGGKWEGLERTIAVLEPGGVLLVDDMSPQSWWSDEQRRNQDRVRATLLEHPQLLSAEIDAASGMILAVKRRRG
jgi:demethylmenaquinone methyltransferase/2-methoxy-6-polyprenyl-1,4-benzoquinol methylase